RQEQDRQQQQERIGEIVREVEERLELDVERHILAAEDRRQELLGHLDRSLGPTELLRLERVHLDRQLRRRDDVLQIDELPALELRAIREIHVLGQGVVRPAARV